MICPFCGFKDTDVYNSRPTREGTQVWRRRRCPSCHQTFSTYEQINLSYLRIIKSANHHENYSRARLFSSLLSLRNHNQPQIEEIDALVDTIEVRLVKLKAVSIYKVQYLRVIAATLAQYNYELYLGYVSRVIGVRGPKELKNILKELSTS